MTSKTERDTARIEGAESIARIERARRAERIAKFTEKQKRNRHWIALSWAIDWLAKSEGHGGRSVNLNDALVAGSAKELGDALLSNHFTRQITKHGMPAPRVLFLALERSHSKMSFKKQVRLTYEDLEVARKSPGMQSAAMMLPFLLRLWVPRDLLLKLFQEKRWITPSWLNDPLVIPPKSIDAEMATDPVARRRPGRKKGQGSYALADASLIIEMGKMIADHQVASPEEAARKVASRAIGAGTTDSKAERLARRFRK